MARWTYTTGKVHGGFGETDYDKKIIKIDKKKHRKTYRGKHLTPNKDGSENMAITIKHELLHKQHPTWGEKRVETAARSWADRANQKQKQRNYSKFK